MSGKDAAESTRAELERTREHLRRHVEESGFTQRALARKLGMSQAGFTNIFRKSAGVPTRRVLEILDAIGVPPHSFYGSLYGFPTADLEARLSSLTDVLVGLGLVTEKQLQGALQRHQVPSRPK